jgi:hypothetical protein
VYFNGSINNFQPDLIFSLTAFLMGDFRQKKGHQLFNFGESQLMAQEGEMRDVVEFVE